MNKGYKQTWEAIHYSESYTLKARLELIERLIDRYQDGFRIQDRFSTEQDVVLILLKEED